ncbi:hypothetical protein HGB07_01460 [Candidatus Roizmanbacteria bacterium]|nr:hypothetical protein [Candidatus Roizmanbacteria bacterium]
MKFKITIFILIIVLVTVMTVVLLLQQIRGKTSSLETNNPIRLAPTSLPSKADPAKETISPVPTAQYLQYLKEHHGTTDTSTSPLIESAELQKLEGFMNVDLQLLPAYSYERSKNNEKFSPSQTYSAKTQNNNLIVTNIKTKTTFIIKPDAPVESLAFSWLKDDALLLSEKRSDELKVDMLYYVEVPSGHKTFMTGSFPVAARFASEAGPKVYKNSSGSIELALFLDNNGQLWALTIKYR